MAGEDPNVPSAADQDVPVIPVVGGGGGGGKRGGVAGPDATTAGQLIQTTAARAPLLQQSADVEAGRQAQVGQILSDSSEAAKTGYAANQGNLEAAANKYSEHNDEIWNKLNSMSPLMTREQYWNSKSTGDKIIAGIGLALGGASGTSAMQNAIDKDFDIDQKQHQQDFKRYADMHGIDNDEINQAKYMNLARNMYVVNGLKLAQQDIAAETAKYNSEQVKLNGKQAILDLQDRIFSLQQVGRDQAKAAGAAQQARLDKIRGEVRQDALAMVEKTKDSDHPLSLEESTERVIKNDPYVSSVLGKYNMLPPEMQKDEHAMRAVQSDVKDFKKAYGRDPNADEQRQMLEQRLGPMQKDGSFGTPGKNQWIINKDGRLEHLRADASGGQPGISTTARKEGRVVQVPDDNGKLVEREVINPESGKRIEDFREAAQKAGRVLGILKDPNSNIEQKTVALEELKDLKAKLETGTGRVAGQNGGLLGSALDALKANAVDDKVLNDVIRNINDSWVTIANQGIRGGYKGPSIIAIAAPSSSGVPEVLNPVTGAPMPGFKADAPKGDSSGATPFSMPYNPVTGAPTEAPKRSFADKYKAQ